MSVQPPDSSARASHVVSPDSLEEDGGGGWWKDTPQKAQRVFEELYEQSDAATEGSSARAADPYPASSGLPGGRQVDVLPSFYKRTADSSASASAAPPPPQKKVARSSVSASAVQTSPPKTVNRKEIVSCEKEKEKVIEVVESNGLQLERYPQFRNDIDVVIAAVHQNPDALQFVDPTLQKDPRVQFVCEGAKKHRQEDLRNEAIQDVKMKGKHLKNYPNFQNDIKVVLAAIRSNSGAYAFASKRLQEDPQVRKEAGLPPIEHKKN